MASYPFVRALVTGASSGIGEDMARLLGAARVPMVLVARRRDRLEALAAQHPGTEVIAADLRTPEGVAAVEARITDAALPEVDLVVNNAGFGTSGYVHELDPDRLADEVRLNVLALLRLSHAAARTMVPRGRGYLLNVSSIASFQPGPGLAVYSATKAFVTSFTGALHEELRGTGVRVTALCPGLTHTEFQSVSNTTGLESRYPDFAWMGSAEVARAGLDAVAAGRAMEVPGAVNKAVVAASTLTPPGLARRIAALTIRRR
ncbi:MAG: hypothetical protein RL283_1475 [Actinomycetota bacterium]|jgi:short-subunit dehydrogenase